jgi:hypothetical protein
MIIPTRGVCRSPSLGLIQSPKPTRRLPKGRMQTTTPTPLPQGSITKVLLLPPSRSATPKLRPMATRNTARASSFPHTSAAAATSRAACWPRTSPPRTLSRPRRRCAVRLLRKLTMQLSHLKTMWRARPLKSLARPETRSIVGRLRPSTTQLWRPRTTPSPRKSRSPSPRRPYEAQAKETGAIVAAHQDEGRLRHASSKSSVEDKSTQIPPDAKA